MVKKVNTKEIMFQRLREKREKPAFFGVKIIGLFGSQICCPVVVKGPP